MKAIKTLLLSAMLAGVPAGQVLAANPDGSPTADELKAQPAVKADAALSALAKAYLEACVTRDADYVFAHSIDLPKGSFTGITTGSGTDWSLQHAAGHLRGLKPVKWEGLDPQGWVVGDFAWFSGLAKGIIPSGEALTIRISLVMRKIGNDWKGVHWQVSEGVDRTGIRKDEPAAAAKPAAK